MMNKFATVLYAYSPKNDDELELTVGDKIEVMGIEEEGWWRGRLNGRMGVFPSNFVQVIESTSSPSSISSSTHPSNKLKSIFGSKVTPKNSISSNSLNNINNNNNSSSNNNNNSGSNGNIIMNNTQHEVDSTNEYPFASADDSLHSSTSSSERRPKPIRGVGYGDILAAGLKTKPLPADPSKPMAMASERLSQITNNLANSIQKPIPKKPPPPAPSTAGADISSNGSTSDQAPALPPKPSNQFSSYMQQQQQHSRPTTMPVTHSQSTNNNLQRGDVREQARVVYAYKQTNPDELTIEVGDIINVIDKNIEDVGWWKGELNGKIGVFPDNFVELIPVASDNLNQDWSNSSRTSSDFNQHSIGSSEGKMKSVFAGTPKGFSKELESNLEKHNNPASFLSLKRNKLQQQMSSTSSANNPVLASHDSSYNKNELENLGPLETNSAKLNHITANRAKGPARRPPSNVLGKRNQPVESNVKRESNGRDDFALGSLPASTAHQAQVSQEAMASLPIGHNNNMNLNNGTNHPAGSNNNDPSKSTDFVADNQSATPKTSQRANQADKPVPATPTVAASTTSPPTSRPPWMVELRKSNLEKKRDVPSATNQDDEQPTTPVIASKVTDSVIGHKATTTNSNVSTINSGDSTPTTATSTKTSVQSLREAYNPAANSIKGISSRYSANSELTSSNNAHHQGAVVESSRLSLSGQESMNQINDTSPVTNRLNSLLNKTSPPTRADFVSSPSSHQNVSSESNGNNNSNVPSNVSKFSSAKPINTTTTHQTNSNNDTNNLNSPSILGQSPTTNHKSPLAALIGQNKATPAVASLDKQTNTAGPGEAVISEAQYDKLLKQISKNVTNEINELREEVKRLKEEVACMTEVKGSLDAMKIELKACQSATDNQKRYIRELVNNLADERKKIASMQGEIERNLK